MTLHEGLVSVGNPLSVLEEQHLCIILDAVRPDDHVLPITGRTQCGHGTLDHVSDGRGVHTVGPLDVEGDHSTGCRGHHGGVDLYSSDVVLTGSVGSCVPSAVELLGLGGIRSREVDVVLDPYFGDTLDRGTGSAIEVVLERVGDLLPCCIDDDRIVILLVQGRVGPIHFSAVIERVRDSELVEGPTCECVTGPGSVVFGLLHGILDGDVGDLCRCAAGSAVEVEDDPVVDQCVCRGDDVRLIACLNGGSGVGPFYELVTVLLGG